jgi:hypothetical protein
LDAVYLQTNDADKNEVAAFSRDADGGLSPLGSYATGGRSTGKPHLASQSSIVVSGDRLFAGRCCLSPCATTAGSIRSVTSTGCPQRLPGLQQFDPERSWAFGDGCVYSHHMG